MRRKDGDIQAGGGFNLPAGFSLLKDSLRNKGTAFSDEERIRSGCRGLLPPRVFPMAQQVERALGQLRPKESDLEKCLS